MVIISNGRRSLSDLRPSRLLVTLGLPRYIFTGGSRNATWSACGLYVRLPDQAFHRARHERQR